ncbi:hypothetical protein DH2020_034500 [Rehmannia glutinosa]|uniref:Uncharacterized protein n=1 Tax=Rehmannia glutinosa TaxID=99300 RepID=A0ABR0VAU7_REHGL
MTLAFGHTEFLLPPSTLHRRTIPSRQQYRARKRHRLKPLTVRNQLNSTPSPFDNLLHSLFSQFPSVNSLNYVAPALGLASGLALYFSSNSKKLLPKPKTTGNLDSDIGEWILFTSPTPFNRFVTLRCPSIYFPGNEFLENVNERLVKEDKHYVKLNSGRMIQLVKGDGDVDIDEDMMYQRICVSTEDGGVLSLDWPEDLDLEEERGLDTTVLIVPGTAEGSNERNIRLLQYVDYFTTEGTNIVLTSSSSLSLLFKACLAVCLDFLWLARHNNGSFWAIMDSERPSIGGVTSADSDDISTAIQYINKKRPWTTLMGVGFGYGANMLTKYLAEFGERTPLTAAACIDNPFDLEEAMRSSVHHTDFDQRHTDGLIKILQCNKELFQGRGKGFDVEKALSASSVRDFERAISMVSYGFDTIEEFYAKSSTQDVVGRVKVPVLFIQNDDGKVPLFSIPRSSIAENPYTSLLLCAYSSSSKIMDDTFTFSWCQHLTLEWLTAVELGLLKGRHPLLKDIDVTINPSKGLELVGSRASSRRAGVDKLLNLTNGNSSNPPLAMFQENTATSIQSGSVKDIGEPPSSTKGLQQEDNDIGKQSSATIDAVVEEGTGSSDNERGKVLQSAQVVMNMLDVTMPDTLSDEQKKKVLDAVGQGETLIKALEGAVPEDVRGKLTTAVSGILQSHGSNLKFDKLLSLGQIPVVASGSNSNVVEKIGLAKTNGDEDIQCLDQKKTIDDPKDGSGNDHEDGSSKVDHSSDKPSGDMELEKQSAEILQEPNDKGIYQPTDDLGSNSSDLEKLDLNDVESSLEDEQLSGSSTTEISDRENVPEINVNQETSSMLEGPGGADDIVADQNKVESESPEGHPREENNKDKNDSSVDQNKMSEADHTDDKSSAPTPTSTSETEVMENEAENNQRKDDKGPMSISSQNNANSPPFSVSQALDALTGFDDSTQVAVNSVFHVIEDMIDQLEVEKDKGNEVDNENVSEVNGTDEAKESSEGSVSRNHLTENDQKFARTMDLRSNGGAQSGNSDGTLSYDPAGSGYQNKQQHYAHDEHHSNSSDTKNTRSQLGTENENSMVPAAGQLPAGNFVKCLNSSSENFPGHSTPISSGDPLYKEYLKTNPCLKTRNTKPLDMDEMSALYLDYIPEEGQWKLLEQAEENSASVDEYATHASGFGEDQTNTQPRSKHTDNIVEPYVILDSGKAQDQNEELKEMVIVNDNTEFEDSMPFIKSLILECLNVEVGRRANAADMEELKVKLAREIECVANAVSMAAGQGKLHMGKGNDNLPEKFGTLDGEIIIKAISSAVQDTLYLRRVLPVGVVVGASLAALKKFYNVGNDEKHLTLDQVDKSTKKLVQVGEKESGERLLKKRENKDYSTSSISEEEDIIDLDTSRNNEIMVGAVTAALGASALLAHQQITGTDGTSKESLKDKENSEEISKLDEMPEKTQNNIVTSLAEKAMSVASPVVPIKEDGGVDHERLVSMLAELGQKGGMLKLVGKVALLWGGLRGAMSLTEKLMSFLRIAERPLFQRNAKVSDTWIPGFVFLVLLLWSPVILPFLPTLMQSWATGRPFKIAEFACIAGLYVSIMIMVTLWGKRVRKYDDPLLQYGLDLASVPKFQNFLKGLVGGATLVILIHAVNSSLGCAHLCWPSTLSPSSSEPVALIKSYGWMLTLIAQGIATATGVSVVEELLFRSWLPQEIAADFGYYRGIVISGLLFALLQRSTWEIPGLWLLSLSLSGARQRSSGSLSLSIGLRAGILASNFILKKGGFLTYQPNIPLWVTGGHPFQPFSGVVGLAFSLVLAVILYPRPPVFKTTRVIRE